MISENLEKTMKIIGFPYVFCISTNMSGSPDFNPLRGPPLLQILNRPGGDPPLNFESTGAPPPRASLIDNCQLSIDNCQLTIDK